MKTTFQSLNTKTMLAHQRANNCGPFFNSRRRGKRCTIEDVRRAAGLDRTEEGRETRQKGSD